MSYTLAASMLRVCGGGLRKIRKYVPVIMR
jgi:hypothetical protein